MTLSHNVMRTAVFDLALMAGANGDYGSSAGHACANAAGRVFEYKALGGVVPETFGSEEEGMGSWLSSFEAIVVSSD